MRSATLLFFLLAAGCNAPSPAFMGADMQTVTVDGSTFDVRRSDNRAELIRTNSEMVFGMRSLVPKAAEAVRIATGCTPVPGTWQGDAAMMRVEVDCEV